MKKDSKQRLFEVMGKLDSSFKLNENINSNLSPKEQQILNDIISINESNNNSWWNKFVEYGRKGLLTSAIVFALAFSSQVMGENKSGDVIKAGIEMTERNQEEDLLNFLIGFTTDEINHAKQTNDLNSYYYQGIQSVRDYAINRKQNKETFLDAIGQASLRELFKLHKELNKDEIVKYMKMGEKLN